MVLFVSVRDMLKESILMRQKELYIALSYAVKNCTQFLHTTSDVLHCCSIKFFVLLQANIWRIPMLVEQFYRIRFSASRWRRCNKVWIIFIRWRRWQRLISVINSIKFCLNLIFTFARTVISTDYVANIFN